MTSKTEEQAIRALSQACFGAIESNDVETAMDCFAPDVQIWHLSDETYKGRDYVLNLLNGLSSRVQNLRFSDRRLTILPGGLLQQHVMEGTRVGDGGKARAPTCLVSKVRIGDDGKARFTRMEEYFDSAHQATFHSKTTSSQ